MLERLNVFTVDYLQLVFHTLITIKPDTYFILTYSTVALDILRGQFDKF